MSGDKLSAIAGEGLDAGLRAAEDQRVDVVRAFVGIDHLEVDDMADDAELVGDAVAAQHVAREARDLQRLAARIALHDRGDLDRRAALVLHAPEAQAALQAEGDLGLHVGELLLDQLVRGQRPAELLALEDVLPGAVPAVLGGAERAPGDAVARRVEAGERALEAAHFRKRVLLRAEHVVHNDLAGDGGAQAHLAVDLRRRKTVEIFFQYKAPDLARIILGPDDEDVGDGRVGDPRLGARQAVAALHLLRARLHRAWIGAVIGLGEAEAADPCAGGELRQVFPALRFGAELEDRQHDERGLHAHHRAVARVDALHLACDQAVGDVVEPGGAVLGRQRRPEHAEPAHLAEDLYVCFLLAKAFEHARRELPLAVVVRRVAHHALFLRQLLVEEQRVAPHELGLGFQRRVHDCVLSRMMARPWPTPMHNDTAAYLPPDCCSSRATVRARRAPEAPSGWPMAIAPPFGLTRGSFRSTFISLRQPSTWLAKASLISMMSISASFSPARSRARGIAYAGPTPMMRGSTPALAADRMRAIGFFPLLFPHPLDPMTSAAAPSLIPEALPAVTTPPSNRGLSFASWSSVASRRGCSSRLIVSPAASFFLAGKVMAWISPWKNPSFSARAYFCCDARANSSACSRAMPKSLATLSPVCGIE